MKYEFTGEISKYLGKTLHRIRTVSDIVGTNGISHIEAGTLGGWIEKEDNLSQFGSCWIFDGARVFNDAQVREDAWIRDRATIYDKAHVYGNAFVYGDAIIRGKSKVFGKAVIGMGANIDDYAEVSGSATIGRAFVGDTSKVFDNVMLDNNVKIVNDAYVGGFKDYFSISNLGNHNEVVAFMKSQSNRIIVSCVFFCGTIDDFAEAIKKEYSNDDKSIDAYRLAIELAKLRIDLKGDIL